MFLNSSAKDFDKLAEGVVNTFFKDVTPLGDVIVKVANDLVLNPEEVKRLVEKSNTLATIKMIKSASGGSLEFALADFTKVSKETHPEVEPVAGKADVVLSSVPGVMLNTQKIARDVSSFFTALLAKSDTEKKASDTKPSESLRRVFTLQKNIEELGRQKVACELLFKKSADSLLSEFSNLYAPDFQKFANEVYTLYGETSVPLLQALAADIRQPTEFSKVAYCIDDISDNNFDLFKAAHTAITDVCTISQQITSLKLDVDKAWRDVKTSQG